MREGIHAMSMMAHLAKFAIIDIATEPLRLPTEGAREGTMAAALPIGDE